MPQLSTHGDDTELQREAVAIGLATTDRSPMSRNELRERVGARFWGPRRFPRALRHALHEGLVRSTGHGTYHAPEQAHGDQTTENR
jgi:hypothetical protein